MNIDKTIQKKRVEFNIKEEEEDELMGPLTTHRKRQRLPSVKHSDQMRLRRRSKTNRARIQSMLNQNDPHPSDSEATLREKRDNRIIDQYDDDNGSNYSDDHDVRHHKKRFSKEEEGVDTFNIKIEEDDQEMTLKLESEDGTGNEGDASESESDSGNGISKKAKIAKVAVAKNKKPAITKDKKAATKNKKPVTTKHTKVATNKKPAAKREKPAAKREKPAAKREKPAAMGGRLWKRPTYYDDLGIPADWTKRKQKQQVRKYRKEAAKASKLKISKFELSETMSSLKTKKVRYWETGVLSNKWDHAVKLAHQKMKVYGWDESLTSWLLSNKIMINNQNRTRTEKATNPTRMRQKPWVNSMPITNDEEDDMEEVDEVHSEDANETDSEDANDTDSDEVHSM